MHRPSVLALVESRISGTRAQSVCDKIVFINCFRIEAQGLQGGIWTLWNSEDIRFHVINSHEQFVMVEVKPQRQMSWLLTFVYASPHIQAREVLWQELQQFASKCRIAWLLVGILMKLLVLRKEITTASIC